VAIGSGHHPTAAEVVLNFRRFIRRFNDEEFGHGTRFGIIKNRFGGTLQLVFNGGRP
jgi:hypothetical protein